MGYKGPSFGNLKDKRGLQDKSPVPEGHHYSLILPNPIISSALTLWTNAELFIFVGSLINLLLVALPLGENWRYLSILMIRL